MSSSTHSVIFIHEHDLNMASVCLLDSHYVPWHIQAVMQTYLRICIKLNVINYFHYANEEENNRKKDGRSWKIANVIVSTLNCRSFFQRSVNLLQFLRYFLIDLLSCGRSLKWMKKASIIPVEPQQKFSKISSRVLKAVKIMEFSIKFPVESWKLWKSWNFNKNFQSGFDSYKSWNLPLKFQ